MKNSATRACKGCDGSGVDDTVCGRCCQRADLDVIAVFGLCAPCADYESETKRPRPRPTAFACPACLGTGSVTDGPFRRDAEVDAETLRVVGRGHSWATQHGMLDGTTYSHEPDATADESRDVASYAARAAFRAVPALRGE
jgi:hypothetical protein